MLESYPTSIPPAPLSRIIGKRATMAISGTPIKVETMNSSRIPVLRT